MGGYLRVSFVFSFLRREWSLRGEFGEEGAVEGD